LSEEIVIRRWLDCVDVVFGSGGLFDFIEERFVRKLLGEVVRELAAR